MLVWTFSAQLFLRSIGFNFLSNCFFFFKKQYNTPNPFSFASISTGLRWCVVSFHVVFEQNEIRSGPGFLLHSADGCTLRTSPTETAFITILTWSLHTNVSHFVSGVHIVTQAMCCVLCVLLVCLCVCMCCVCVVCVFCLYRATTIRCVSDQFLQEYDPTIEGTEYITPSPHHTRTQYKNTDTAQTHIQLHKTTVRLA